MKRIMVLALVVCFAGGTLVMAQRKEVIWLDHPPWAECPKPGVCFSYLSPDEVVFLGIVDAENEWLILGPMDTTKYWFRLSPNEKEAADHWSNMKLPAYYCAGEACAAVWHGTACEYPWTEECLKANGFMAGTGVTASGNWHWIYVEPLEYWDIACPESWTAHGTVYDEENHAYKVSSIWLTVPSQHEPSECYVTDDQLWCWPCRYKTIEVEISPK